MPTSSCTLLPDCDLHCKPARGSYRISLKKFCRKDYGRPPSGLLTPSSSPCPTFPLYTLTLAGPQGHPPALRSSAVAGPALSAPVASPCSRCGVSSLCSSSTPPPTPAGALSSSARPAPSGPRPA